jgi:hypothetical protein
MDQSEIHIFKHELFEEHKRLACQMDIKLILFKQVLRTSKIYKIAKFQ